MKYFHGGVSIDRDSQVWIEKALNRLPAVYWKAEYFLFIHFLNYFSSDMPNCIDTLRYCLSTPFDVKMDPFRKLLASILVRRCSSQEYPKLQKEDNRYI